MVDCVDAIDETALASTCQQSMLERMGNHDIRSLDAFFDSESDRRDEQSCGGDATAAERLNRDIDALVARCLGT